MADLDYRDLLLKIWEKEQIPNSWNEAIIQPLFKKEDAKKLREI